MYRVRNESFELSPYIPLARHPQYSRSYYALHSLFIHTFHSIESIEPLVRDREARRRALGATRARERSPRQARCDAQLRCAAPFNTLAPAYHHLRRVGEPRSPPHQLTHRLSYRLNKIPTTTISTSRWTWTGRQLSNFNHARHVRNAMSS